MKNVKSKFPVEKETTIRIEIMELLKNKELSMIEISKLVGISEKNISNHIEHIKKSLSNTGYFLKIKPAVCLECGYTFRKREKIKKPTKCPICRSEHIEDPLFKIEKTKM